ncbi:hypothetical protein BX600DRAFT_509881 [Xylariales sp. PMI_506]|nr:hypothetical protein BX600DRAFT_509881 [Xylariales sp. PMI_506]
MGLVGKLRGRIRSVLSRERIASPPREVPSSLPPSPTSHLDNHHHLLRKDSRGNHHYFYHHNDEVADVDASGGGWARDQRGREAAAAAALAAAAAAGKLQQQVNEIEVLHGGETVRVPGVHPHERLSADALGDRADAQAGSDFFARLPPELRRMVYVELWTSYGLVQHIHREKRIVNRGVNSGVATAAAATATATATSGAGASPPSPEQAGGPRLRTMRHVPCERLRGSGNIVAPGEEGLRTGPCGHLGCLMTISESASPFISVLLTCARMYLECRESLYENITFSFVESAAFFAFMAISPPECVRAIRSMKLICSLPLHHHYHHYHHYYHHHHHHHRFSSDDSNSDSDSDVDDREPTAALTAAAVAAVASARARDSWMGYPTSRVLWERTWAVVAGLPNLAEVQVYLKPAGSTPALNWPSDEILAPLLAVRRPRKFVVNLGWVYQSRAYSRMELPPAILEAAPFEVVRIPLPRDAI